jgi:hypothetical protein
MLVKHNNLLTKVYHHLNNPKLTLWFSRWSFLTNYIKYSCAFLEHIHNYVMLLLKMEFQQSPKLQLQQNLIHEIMNSKQQTIQLALNI